MSLNKSTPKIGWWWAFCCELDLYEITTEDELLSAVQDLSLGGAGAWPTEAEGRAALRAAGLGKDDM